MKLFVFIFALGLIGCVMPESYLQQTELIYANSVDSVKIEYYGNVVYLVNEHSNKKKYQDKNGVYKYKYEFQKTKGGYQVTSLAFYDTTGALLDTNSANGYAQSVTRYTRNNKIKKQLFLDKNGDLYQPSYIPYAKQTQKHKKKGVWIERFYDSNNNPRCGNLGFKLKKQWDTLYVQQGDSMTYYLRIKEIYKLDCEKKKLK